MKLVEITIRVQVSKEDLQRIGKYDDDNLTDISAYAELSLTENLAEVEKAIRNYAGCQTIDVTYS